MELLEKQSRYFNIEQKQKDIPGKSDLSNKPDLWISRRDLEHTEEINKVGLNDRSYNHEKYGRRPPIHQYSVIGSILQPGMDFNETEKEELKGPYGKPEVRKNPDWLRHEKYLKDVAEKKNSESTGNFSGLQLPRNIQHKFGTKLCQSLLSDKEKVDKTLEGQNKLQESVRKNTRRYPIKEISSDPALDPTYDALGGVLRHNLFPGHNFDHKVGVIKGDFNDHVHKNRVPDPDEYRYRRDELSKFSSTYILLDIPSLLLRLAFVFSSTLV